MATMTLEQFSQIMMIKSNGLDSHVFKIGQAIKDQYAKHVKENAQGSIYNGAGNRPNRYTHNLWKSITANIRKDRDALRVSVQAGSDLAFYSKFVEFGSSRYNVNFVGRFFLKRGYDEVNRRVLPQLLGRLDTYMHASHGGTFGPVG